MAAVNGSYILEKNENLEALLKAVGVKEEKIQKISGAHPTLEINLAGDKLTITSQGEEKTENVITLGAPSVWKLQSGIEIEVNVSKTENKSLKGTLTKGKHTGELTVEFDGTHLIETFNLCGIVTKRYYKKA